MRAGPADPAPELAGTSTMTTRLVLRLADHVGGEGTARRVLARAGLESQETELTSAHGRVPYPTKLRLMDALADELRDPDVGRRLGAAALLDPALAPFRAVVRAVGSPEAVLRHVSRVSTRLDTATVFRCLESVPGRARLSWRVLPPHRPSRIDCDYTVGMLEQVPVLFGLPPAEVQHETCQVDGAQECRYTVTWHERGRRRGRDRRGTPAGRALSLDAAVLVEDRLGGLQEAVTDLAGEVSLEETLDRVAQRADRAVHAPGHVLDVRLPGGNRHVRSRGLGDRVLRELGDRRLRPGLQRVGGAEVLAVPVTGATGAYGVLAAVAQPGQAFFPEDEAMLAAFARHAAVAVRMAGLLTEAKAHEETARLLLSVARKLAGRRSVRQIAQEVADAVPVLSSADRSAVALWEPGVEGIWIAGASGWPDDLVGKVADYVTSTEESPELCQMVSRGQPMLVDRTASPWARDVLDEFGLRAMAGVPITSDGRLAGIVLAYWADGEPPAALDDTLVERLWGLAGLAGVALDNSKLLDEVRWQAAHDALTGLPNRAEFETRLAATTERLGRDLASCAVLFCDVSRLARINDSLGHEAGDHVLRQVGQRLASAVREGDLVARYSGDEFAVLLLDVGTAEARRVAARIRDGLSRPVRAGDGEVFVELATGTAVATASTAGDDRPALARGLLARATEDMHASRARSRGLPARPDRSPQRLRLETELHGAVRRDEIRVHYQPQVEILTGRPVAVEALARWVHPELGPVPPDVFIPLAEDCGLIHEIGTHVLREACRTVAGWGADGVALEVSVNVSAAQLGRSDFTDLVRRILDETGLRGERLTLEITESQVVTDLAERNRHLRRLRSLGLGISVDDFGTGYSSLAQLHRLPATEVKIDRSFMATSAGGDLAGLVAGIVGLGHGLGLRVVAEGVETPAQLHALAAIGCDRAQGYLLGRPADAAAVLGALRECPVNSTAIPDPR
ncbi:putative bifunctional diguanylate cyclase/phosphodiesterase [Geodermatophilus sp. SYSU D00815]